MKLRINIIELLCSQATAAEIDFIIYIGQFQNEFGRIQGLKYQDVMDGIGISKSNFYRIIHSLEAKGFIQVNYMTEDYAMWDITILNNDFTIDKSLKNGYLNLNHEILHASEFYRLKKSEKVIILHILSLNRSFRNVIKITIEKIMEWTKCTRASVLKYIHTLSNLQKLLTIERIGNAIHFHTFTKAFTRREASEKDIYHRHILKYIMRKLKLSAIEKDIKDTLILFKQYDTRLGFSGIMNAIIYCLKQKATLIPAYINTVINRMIDGEFIKN